MSKRFPILKRKWQDPKQDVPWDFVQPHEKQAQANHYQSLQQLAGRGGLSWCELYAVVTDQKWKNEPNAEQLVLKILYQWKQAQEAEI